MSVRHRVFRILDPRDSGSATSVAVNQVITFLILLNVIAVVVESMPKLHPCLRTAFHALEIISVMAFTVEYALRLWSIVEDPRYRHPFKGRLRYAWSFLALVDLLAIAPFYVPFLISVDLRFLRGLRLFRTIRLLKLSRYSRSIQLLWAVMRATRREMAITIVSISFLCLLIACLIFYVERDAQPDVFSSIPVAIWWAAAVLTGVGTPEAAVTSAGKALTILVAFLGIALFAIPAGIFSSAFLNQMLEQAKDGEVRRCPHCGEKIDPN